MSSRGYLWEKSECEHKRDWIRPVAMHPHDPHHPPYNLRCSACGMTGDSEEDFHPTDTTDEDNEDDYE